MKMHSIDEIPKNNERSKLDRRFGIRIDSKKQKETKVEFAQNNKEKKKFSISYDRNPISMKFNSN